MKKYLIGLGWFSVSLFSQANIVINGTRVIYPEKNKNITVQLQNSGNQPALVQAWLDNGDIDSTPETASVPFFLSPPVTKVNGSAGQQLRITKTGAALPADRESIFYLNVLDIPPVSESMQQQNTLQLAIKTRIKLFYRPQALRENVATSLDNLSLKAEGKGLTLANDSPYFITVANITQGADKPLLTDSLMLTPFSSQYVPVRKPLSKNAPYSVMYIDDLGVYRTKAVSVK